MARRSNASPTDCKLDARNMLGSPFEKDQFDMFVQDDTDLLAENFFNVSLVRSKLCQEVTRFKAKTDELTGTRMTKFQPRNTLQAG
jgi:hypothetical protein